MSFQLQITGIGNISTLQAGIAYINNATPYQGALQVNTNGGGILINSDNSNFGLALRNSSSSNKLWDISSFNNDLVINEGAVATRMYFKAGGGIGIGNTTPTFALDVTGTARFTGILTLGSTLSNGTYFYTLPSATGTLALTSDIPSISATAPLYYTAGVLSISQATTSTNGYLSSTDWNTFNNKQASGNYITALTGEATASGPGSAAVTLTNSAVIGKVLTGLTITGGTLASTDSILTAFGKVQNQINSLVGGVIYQGAWNASTNTPTLTSSVGTKGYYYVVSVAGNTNLNGINDWKIGDWAIFDGSTWQKVDNTDSITSVGITSTATALTISNSPLTSSGSIGVNFAGSSAQYVAGDGSLITFPSLSGYVPYTGATGAVNLGAYDLTVQGLTIGKGASSLANNTALGYGTLFHITTGNYNTAVGYESLHNTTTGQYNTALGQSSLFTNTTGSQNTALGLNALLYNTTGGSNVVVGVDAFQHNTTGSSNTVLGYNAGSHITGGSTPNTTASNSVFIGRDSKAKLDGGINEIVIGYNAIGNGSNTATFGNTSTTANYFTGSINAGSFIKSGGTSSQYLMADGSVTTGPDLTGYVTLATTQTITGAKTFTATSTKFSKIRVDNSTDASPIAFKQYASGSIGESGNTSLSAIGANQFNINWGGTKTAIFDSTNIVGDRTYILPNADGTIALTSDIPSLTGYVTLATTQTITGAKTFNNNLYIDTNAYWTKMNPIAAISGKMNLYAPLGTSSSFVFLDGDSAKSARFDFDNTANRTYTFPSASGTLALTSQLTSGTVTSVAALTLGTTGTDLSSTVANGTTTPVITLNVPTASATNRGALSSADWTTFNSKASTASLANYLPLAGGTMTGAIVGTTSTFTNAGSGIGLGITNSSTGDGLKITHSAGRALNIASSGSGYGIIISNDIASTSIPFTIQKSGSNVITMSDTGAANFTVQLTIGSTITNGTNTNTRPSSSGNLDLTSALSGYLPLAGGTLTGALIGTSATFTTNFNGSTWVKVSNSDTGSGAAAGFLMANQNGDLGAISLTSTANSPSNALFIRTLSTNSLVLGANGGQHLTIASTGAATFDNNVKTRTLFGFAAYTTDTDDFGMWATSGGGTTIATAGATNILFRTNNAERMRITSGGNLGLGTTSGSGILFVKHSGTGFVTGINSYCSANDSFISMAHTGSVGIISTSYNSTGSYLPLTFATSDTERMRITSTGNVGIGTTSPAYKLDVSGGDLRIINNSYPRLVINNTSASGKNYSIYSNDNGNLTIGQTGVADYINVTSGGVITIANLAGTGSRAVLADANGLLSAPVSDISVKQNITPIGYGLNEILKMNPVWFDYINEYKNYGEGRQNGNIAQDIEKIIPEAVFVTPTNGKMGINYDQLHAVYIKAIQELKAEIEELKNK